VAWLILIAGPNGAGKTTLTGDANFQKPAAVFRVARSGFLTRTRPPKSITRATQISRLKPPIFWRQMLFPRRWFSVSTLEKTCRYYKYEPIIRQALALCLALDSARVSKARVAKRVATGGHAVPDDRIRPRWRRSIDNLVKFAPMMDGLLLFLSSSTSGFRLLTEKHQGQVRWYGGALFPILRQRLGAHPATSSGARTGGMPFRSKS
jgi:predicted ABC-type ATPase